LRGLKENVAVGRLIPAGTGSPHLSDIIVQNPEADINEKNMSEEESESVETQKSTE